MITFVFAIALQQATLAGSTAYDDAVGKYGVCLGRTFAQARREKVTLSAFRVRLGESCVEEERMLDIAVVRTLISQKKISESEAKRKVQNDKDWLRAQLLEAF